MENMIRMEPVATKWNAFGFAVREVDGQNHAELLDTLTSVPLERSKQACVIANTTKAVMQARLKGVSA